MDPEQFDEIIHIAESISQSIKAMPHTHPITASSDWPLLASMGGIIVALILFIWNDLKTMIRENDKAIARSIDRETSNRKEQNNEIWAEIRRCQENCPATGEARPRKKDRE